MEDWNGARRLQSRLRTRDRHRRDILSPQPAAMLWAMVELRASPATDKDRSGTRRMGTSGLAQEVKGSLTMRAFTETESASAMMSRPFATIFGIVGRRRTYSRMCYLFATFPLGLLYFITVVVGL